MATNHDLPLDQQIVTGILRAIAGRQNELITYGEVLSLFKCSPNDPVRQRELHHILDLVNQKEKSECRPLLSAVAVNQDTRACGTGFHKMAKRLGVQKDSEDDAVFFKSQLDTVRKFWSS